MARPEPVAVLAGLLCMTSVWVLTPSAPAPASTRVATSPVPVTPARVAGSLSGLSVYLSAGHGWVSHDRGRGYQRPESHGLVEDTWTATFVAGSLAPALERAGATVITARERDRNGAAVIVDDTDARFATTGALWRERAPRRAGTPTTIAGGDATLLDADGTATWTLTVPWTGTWYLYTSWMTADDRDPAARYTVTVPGAATRFDVDQRVHGGAWWNIGAYDLRVGDPVVVTLSGSGQGTLSANAVRLGGGSTSVVDVRTGVRSWHPSWQVAALHLLPGAGVPADVWRGVAGGMGGDAGVRARWADWAHPAGEEAVYLSIHTDAGGGRGTTAYIRHHCYGLCSERTRRSEALADTLRTTLLDAVRGQLDPTWVDRGTRQASLAEVSEELQPEVPAALLELGFHDDPLDAAALGDPAYARIAADALVTGLVRWRLGPDAPLPPPPPRDVVYDGTDVLWSPGAAIGWRVRALGAEGWSAPAWATAPRFRATHATAVEITAVGEGGLAAPVVLTLDGDALACAPPPEFER